jgi:hypothetical protein
MKFDDLDFRPHPNAPSRGTQALVKFPNGWSASVIDGDFSIYMGKGSGVYEIMAIRPDGELADDGEGELGQGPFQGDEAEIERILALIEAQEA